MEDFKYSNIKSKDSIVKKIVNFLKEKQIKVSLMVFCLIAVAVVLIAVLVLQEFVISVCILVILEAAMAALLHKVELWKHGILLAAQLIVAALIQQIALAGLCIVVYVAAIAALQVMGRVSR